MANHVQLDLPVLLPDVPDATDDCVERLIQSLINRAGVARAHITPGENGEPDRLCIHYDPDTVSLPNIRQLAKTLGAEITDQYGHLVWSVQGITHPRRARTIAKRLRQTLGVVEAEASAAERIRVEFDRSETDEGAIRDVLRSMGVRIHGEVLDVHKLDEETDKEDRQGHDHGGIFGERTELIFASIAGICVSAGFGLSFVDGVSGWWPDPKFEPIRVIRFR